MLAHRSWQCISKCYSAQMVIHLNKSRAARHLQMGSAVIAKHNGVNFMYSAELFTPEIKFDQWLLWVRWSHGGVKCHDLTSVCHCYCHYWTKCELAQHNEKVYTLEFSFPLSAYTNAARIDVGKEFHFRQSGRLLQNLQWLIYTWWLVDSY